MMDRTLIQIRKATFAQSLFSRDYSARRSKLPGMFIIFFFKTEANLDRLTQFMHQNGLPQAASQLALQARVRARAWRRGSAGDGDFALTPIPTDREMEASVPVWECSSDVTGYTASSSNPAGTFTTGTHFGYQRDGAACYEINWEDVSSASDIESDVKKKKKKKTEQLTCSKQEKLH